MSYEGLDSMVASFYCSIANMCIRATILVFKIFRHLTSYIRDPTHL
jgi:hypothetical protein